MERVLKPLAKSVLFSIFYVLCSISFNTSSYSERNVFGSGTIALIISNKKMNDIMKTVKFLQEPGLLIVGINETIKKEAKEQKYGFLGMLLYTLGPRLSGNLLTGKGVMRAGGNTIKAGEGTIRADQDFYCHLIATLIRKE